MKSAYEMSWLHIFRRYKIFVWDEKEPHAPCRMTRWCVAFFRIDTLHFCKIVSRWVYKTTRTRWAFFVNPSILQNTKHQSERKQRDALSSTHRQCGDQKIARFTTTAESPSLGKQGTKALKSFRIWLLVRNDVSHMALKSISKRSHLRY